MPQCPSTCGASSPNCSRAKSRQAHASSAPVTWRRASQPGLEIFDRREHEEISRARGTGRPARGCRARTSSANCSSFTRATAPMQLGRAAPDAAGGFRRGVQREGGGQLLDLRLDPRQRSLVRVGERAVDQLGHPHHFGRAHAARRERRCAEPDAAGDERRLRIVGNGVLVHRDAGLVEHLLGDLPGEVLGPEIDQHQVGVGAAGHDGEAALDQRLRQRLGVVHHLAGVDA